MSLSLSRRGLFASVVSTMMLVSETEAECSSKAQPSETNSIKEMPHDWSLPPILFFDNKQRSKSLSDFTGAGIVLNVWATWCSPCVKEIITLEDLAQTVASEKIFVIPVASDLGGVQIVEAFYKRHGITNLPVFIGGTAISQAWHVDVIPLTVLFNRRGVPRAWVEGEMDWSTPNAIQSVRRLCE
jgi:thiol-disulfide isomerase/thioredoxin